MKQQELCRYITSGKLDNSLDSLYNDKEIASKRYIEAINEHLRIYGERKDISIFSTPGRTEISGNHTDHQHGCVLAGSVNIDVIAIVSKNDDGVIRVHSKGHDENTVKLSDLSVHSEETGSSNSLIRGIAYRMGVLGCAIGGFDAYTTSDVLVGSGLSSSAAFELLISTIINNLYNHDRLPVVELAKLSQFAEREYFGKPSGLMDQMACGTGGCVAIDFKSPETPISNHIDFDLKRHGYNLVIVNTGASHADLVDDYASVPMDMKRVAGFFHENYLRDVNEATFFESISDVRKKVGDKAVLRAIHFFEENNRVPQVAEALKNDELDSFFNLVSQSGISSYEQLQNVYSDKNPKEQSISLALSLSKRVLNGSGAYRVHGGGFAGTIQAFVKNELLDEYIKTLNAVFGDGACHVLNIRSKGSIRVV